MEWLGFFFSLAFVAGLVFTAVLITQWRKIESRKLRQAALAGEGLPYERAKHVLSDAEFALYRMLSYMFRDKYAVLPKVSLADLVDVPKYLERREFHVERLRGKQVDFVLGDLERARPLLVIQFSDSNRGGAQSEEDTEFVEAVLRHLQVPVMRLRSQKSYMPNELQAQIREVIATHVSDEGRAEEMARPSTADVPAEPPATPRAAT